MEPDPGRQRTCPSVCRGIRQRIILLGSLLASFVPVLHMHGAGIVGGRIAVNSSGAFFWVWTLIALGASGVLSVVLSGRALWNLRRSLRK
jgi:hypothetical protein